MRLNYPKCLPHIISRGLNLFNGRILGKNQKCLSSCYYSEKHGHLDWFFCQVLKQKCSFVVSLVSYLLWNQQRNPFQMVQSTQDIFVDSEGQWGQCHILEAGEHEWEPQRDPHMARHCWENWPLSSSVVTLGDEWMLWRGRLVCAKNPGKCLTQGKLSGKVSEENVTWHCRAYVVLWALLLLTTSLYAHWPMMKSDSTRKLQWRHHNGIMNKDKRNQRSKM